MSEILTCENSGAEAETFIASLAVESAEIVAQKFPPEYRGMYLSSYAAALALGNCETRGQAL